MAPPTSAWVMGMLDVVGGGHVWVLVHTVSHSLQLVHLYQSADDGAVAKRRPRSLSPPPTSAWVMGMWDEVGGHVWMLVHTVAATD